MPLWLIPMFYIAGAVVAGFALPRFEQAYLAAYTLGMSVASAQAYLSAAASGMMALTGIVFAMAFVMVQFSAIAYSPRLVLWLARDPILFHALGAFGATFLYALFTLAWIDRGGSGNVPLVSSLIVGLMIVASMLLFARLMQRLSDLQISNVLHLIGDRGREAIGDMFARRNGAAAPVMLPSARDRDAFGPPAQTLKYSGRPLTIAKFNVDALVHQAEQANAIIVLLCAVGDTLVEGATLLRVHGPIGLPERPLIGAIRLSRERTFEQDPKYPIRLLVDVAIRALSPAVNDPTTAVQTIDQIEDLLRRLSRCELDAGYACSREGKLRLVFPMPTFEDYLALGFDEIRQYGASSVQVMRRLRSALAGLLESVSSDERADAVRRSLEHLDLAIENSALDPADRLTARQEDRQGIGLSGRREEG